jgi:hypothetical protein
MAAGKKGRASARALRATKRPTKKAATKKVATKKAVKPSRKIAPPAKRRSAVGAKKALPAKAARPKKAAPTRMAARAKKAAPTRKAAPAVAPTRKAAAARKLAPAKPAAPAAPRRVTPAEVAWASLDTMLQMSSDTHRDEVAGRVYEQRGKEIAVLRRAGSQLVLDFEAPQAMAEFERVRPLYEAVPGRTGWLRFRQPATNDPRPGLEADLGTMLGAADAERNPLPAFRSIVSGGGPYVCMHLSDVGSWSGVCDKDEFPEGAALYEEALRGPDTASLLALPGGRWCLVLGTPDPLFATATWAGGLFARAVAHSMADDQLLAALEGAPTDGWEVIGSIDVREPIRAFDVATFGGAIAEGNSLTLALDPGPYEIACRTWQPDDDTELLLTRLWRK